MRNLLFLGNDGNLIREILELKDIRVVGVVADKVSAEQEKYFGSAYVLARSKKIPVLPQDKFNRGYRKYFKEIFGYPDIIFIQGYHYRIKEDLVKDRKIKIVNFHQSLLPAYAGRHPLNWAVVNGETGTGITFHYVTNDFDAGDIILQKKIVITDKDTVISLYNKTIKAARGCLKEVFRRIFDQSFFPLKQDLSKRMYFAPRSEQDGKILETDTVRQVKDKIRALVYPYPGAFVYSGNKKIIVEAVKRVTQRVRDKRFALRCADGFLKITRVRNE